MMNKKIFVSLLVIILAAAIFFAAAYFNMTEKVERFSKLYLIDDMVRDDYVGEIDEKLLNDMLIKGYVAGIGDKYASYYTTEEYEEYLLSHSGSGGGMGIIVVPYENSGLLKIVQVYEGSPAEKAGLKKNDIIISSGEKQFSDMDYEESVAFLQGETGSVAELEILRLGETISFSVTRDIYDIKTVLVENFNGTGYIKIRQFIQSKTFDEFETAYSDLISQNIDSIIFDVRDNVGGELGTICDVLDLILPEGPIIRYEDTDGIYEQIDSDAECMQNIEAVVLINESTYSAAELFAAALNDYDVATLIGKTTYGKGMMQYTVPFTDGSALKLSISKFYPPYSENFEGVGVIPAIDVDMDYTDISSYYDINYENDTQLIYALNYLK